ncbi:filamentous hemagglutinin N-terminal domain-containing protein [Aetokthonos hydrillicola Thurmond2011]|jgi:filamentous hemagglutinin family protein|uniref:Filamentous hemagglutinin N-terminal domain-containing protein n=1 Tax=Aetokthonos hydrillicola Thurmond2011 TaxID=2712845 RepID=A0AAP5MB34_9CYAN|nr:filamentous hemagglutinin N-terminal domain-containing protein [Aetokthonos hydrillicola]MBO3458178.1 filamentous hemagglutinin N-terminal domain-containing protein [Aetokthonos hydrillicola CCALA 1050]MBW4584398.1 filamentous hemagglutinin N-terminal domain-containing protein [Aetokthonos hydrillicola CCALA 1050]MDR9896359.1 filamentous hemagglutinin N-terminal domain-containing protein [Aetokthonos hydrillicola Thurmond2011]
MSVKSAVWKQLLGLAVSNVCIFSTNCTTAQITPDGTLPNNSNVTLNGRVFNITGGTQAGRNLFHSFQQFSIPTGGTASFNNRLDVQNIFSRVTGGSVSSIDGIIKANGTANLFFLNPSGIIFGKNASLNVGGSFVATTANAIQFGNLGSFSANVPNNPELLTVNPTALFYNQIVKNASIQNSSTAPAGIAPTGEDSSGLRVRDGKSLLLVGGNVSMDGGQLNAYGGRVELGGLAASGNINLILDGNNLRLGFPENVTRASVSLTNQAFVDVSGAGRGDIAVNAQNIEILGGSLLYAGIGQGLGTPETKAGDITLNATEQVKVQQGSQIRNDVYLNATGTGGDLTITTKDLLVSDGAKVGANTFAVGKGGNLTVNALNTQLIGTSTDGSTRSGLYTFAGRGSTGDVGNLTINTQDLLVRDGAEVSTSTLGAGKAGDLTVNATGSVQVIGRSADGRQLASGLFASANQGSTGDAGNLTITAKDLLVRDGAEVIVSTFSAGKGGNLTVNASNSVKLIGTSADGSFTSGLFAEATLNSTGDAAVGKAGSLTITTKDLLVDDGAEVSASTFGVGKGGDLTIKVQNLLVQNGARVSASTFGAASQGSTGDAGDLTITARDVLVERGQISTGTFGKGKGGNLIVNADHIQLIGRIVNVNTAAGGLLASAEPGSTGNAGNLTITTQDLTVSDGASVLVDSRGMSNAGIMTINANRIRLDNEASLNANTRSPNKDPNREQATINVNSPLLILSRGSNITTNATGTGVIGGNINIDTDVLAVVKKSNISANSTDARGGRVVINTQGLFRSPDSTITATGANFQLNGTVQINTPEVDPSHGLVTLPTVSEKPPKLVDSNCRAFNEIAGGSNFTITGRGGLPPSPYEPLTSDAIWSDTRLPQTTAHKNQPNRHAAQIKPKPIEIVPATGWVFNGKGEVTLISSVLNTTSSGTQTSCPAR